MASGLYFKLVVNSYVHPLQIMFALSVFERNCTFNCFVNGTHNVCPTEKRTKRSSNILL